MDSNQQHQIPPLPQIITNPLDLATVPPEHLQWLKANKTQEVIQQLQAERETIRLELETSAIGLSEVRIRGMLIESYTLDCVVNYIRTGNYLGSGELKQKLTKQLAQQQQQTETQEGQE